MTDGIDPEVKKLLDLRLARGDISQEQYLSLRATILESKPAQPSPAESRQFRDVPSDNKPDGDFTVDGDLLVQQSGVTYSGSTFSFSRVTGLMYLAELNSIRVGVSSIPSFYRTTLTLVLDEKIIVAKKAESRFTRKKRHFVLDKAHVYLSKMTFEFRLTRLVNALRAQGSVDLPTEPPTRLFTSGDVVQKDLRTNLRESAEKQQVEFGASQYLYAAYDPDVVKIRIDGPSLFPKTIKFTLRMNRDVIMPLITHLMGHDSL